MSHNRRDPQDVSVPENYLETVEYHNRLFQRHSLENSVYFAPIDEVLTPNYQSISQSSCP